MVVRVGPWKRIVGINFPTTPPVGDSTYIWVRVSLRGDGTPTQNYGGTDLGSYTFPPGSGTWVQFFLTSSKVWGCAPFSGDDSTTPARVIDVMDGSGASIGYDNSELSFSQPALPDTYTFAEREWYGGTDLSYVDPYGWTYPEGILGSPVAGLPFSGDWYAGSALLHRVGYGYGSETKYRNADDGVHDFHYFRLVDETPASYMGAVNVGPPSISFRSKTFSQFVFNASTASYPSSGTAGWTFDVIYKADTLA